MILLFAGTFFAFSPTACSEQAAASTYQEIAAGLENVRDITGLSERIDIFYEITDVFEAQVKACGAESVPDRVMDILIELVPDNYVSSEALYFLRLLGNRATPAIPVVQARLKWWWDHERDTDAYRDAGIIVRTGPSGVHNSCRTLNAIRGGDLEQEEVVTALDALEYHACTVEGYE